MIIATLVGAGAGIALGSLAWNKIEKKQKKAEEEKKDLQEQINKLQSEVEELKNK